MNEIPLSSHGQPCTEGSPDPWALVRRPAAAVPAHLSPGWWLFERPVEVLRASSPAAVPGLLAEVERAAAKGLWSVGFVSYEAAPAFDSAFRTLPLPPRVPAGWFALFGAPRAVDEIPAATSAQGPLIYDLAPSLPEEDYLARVEEVRRWIAAGETYQANLTYRLTGRLTDTHGAPFALFRRLVGDMPPAYATYLELGTGTDPSRPGRAAVCSASPELFFEREPRRLLCRPMKGTAPRGRTTEEDVAAAAALASSVKERAENLMIVDMVRNDLGRLARPRGVRVRELFRIERYPTLFQMTSEVEASTDAGLAEAFSALFPCASITGAPKVRTMEILTDLERTPRGVYTGAVGYVAPGGRARFSVAIRTAWVGPGDDGTSTGVEYGTGGGVVWDSEPRKELTETRTKALVLARALRSKEPAPRLLETLLWRPGKGYYLRDRHLGRLADSGLYFDILVDLEQIGSLLRATEKALRAAGSGPARVRLLVGRHGEPEIETAPFEPSPRPWRLAVASAPVDERDPYLFHKTTRRTVYEAARQSASGADDVLLWNRQGELTESTVANLVLELDGDLVTPDARCGLLPGTLRAELLEQGTIREARLLVEDLPRAGGVWLTNSLRGWIPCTLLDPEPVEFRADGERPAGGPREPNSPAPSQLAARIPSHRPR